MSQERLVCIKDMQSQQCTDADHLHITLQWCTQIFEGTEGGLVMQGFAYVAIGLAAYSALTFPVVVQLIKPKKPQSLEQVPAPKDIESNPGIQASPQRA